MHFVELQADCTIQLLNLDSSVPIKREGKFFITIWICIVKSVIYYFILLLIMLGGDSHPIGDHIHLIDYQLHHTYNHTVYPNYP